MKAVKGTKKKYYKNFIQPILSANGTMGENAFACNQSNYFDNTKLAWKCFDNSFQPADRWQVNNVNTGNWYWVSWYNPTPLNITSLTIYNAQSPYVVKAYKIQGSDDNSNWVDIKTGTNTNTTEYTSWPISMSENPLFYKYHRIYCQPNNSTSIQISEIQITANYESTESDYDFYKDVDVYKAVKEVVRKYYKYGNNYIDTDYIPLMTSTTLPSGSVINTGSLEIHGDATAYGAWGKNQTKRQEWTSNNNISTSYIPALNIPSGHYKLNFQLANYGKWATWLTVKFTLTYSDDTTEDIYTASSGFPPVRSDDQIVYFDYSHEFITSKPIKSIKFSGTSQIGNAGSGFVRSIYIQEQWSPNIPSTYKCLASITGGRFDTNIQMTHNTSIEAESALIANDTNWQYLIDNQSSSGSWFIIGKEQTNTPFTRHFLSSYGSLGVNPTVNQFYHFFIDMSATTKYFYIDNNLGYSTSDSSTGNLGNILRFNHDKYKTKYFKTYNGNMELEHYIVPVKRIADDKIGWYDAIADIFYTDSWLAPITAYEELEYEEGTPSDYDFYEDVEVYKVVKF